MLLLLQVAPQHQSGTKSLPKGAEFPLKSPVGLLCFQKLTGEAVYCWHEAGRNIIHYHHSEKKKRLHWCNKSLPAQRCVSDSKHHGSVH